MGSIVDFKLVVFAVLVFHDVLGKCPKTFPDKVRLDYDDSSYFSFTSDTSDIEDMLKGSGTKFKGPSMSDVTVRIKAKCSIFHTLCEVNIPLAFLVKRLKMTTKCVSRIEFSYESAWAEPVTGTDPDTGEPICISMIGSAVSLDILDIDDSCMWSKTKMKNIGVFSVIDIKFVLDINCPDCKNVMVKSLLLKACGENCPE